MHLLLKIINNNGEKRRKFMVCSACTVLSGFVLSRLLVTSRSLSLLCMCSQGQLFTPFHRIPKCTKAFKRQLAYAAPARPRPFQVRHISPSRASQKRWADKRNGLRICFLPLKTAHASALYNLTSLISSNLVSRFQKLFILCYFNWRQSCRFSKLVNGWNKTKDQDIELLSILISYN